MTRRTNTDKISGPKLISLFTGAGGLDLGLEDAGFETVAANEIEPPACETLRANKVRQQLQNSEFDAWFDKQTQQRCYANTEQAEIERQRIRLRSNPFKTSYLSHAEILEGDIRAISTEMFLAAAKAEIGALDLIAGGPPCQPFSRAGKRFTL